jgi:acetyl esterase/lipase
MRGGLRWGSAGVLVLALAACSGSSDSPAPGGSGAAVQSGSAVSPGAMSPAPASPGAESPATGADAFDPAPVSTVSVPLGRPAKGKVPIVVLVPGGGWLTHDNAGLAPLATVLTDAGLVVVTTSYRAGQDGKRFPVPAQDVTCATAYAARAAADEGAGGGPVIVVGHSAGGHLGALAATSNNALGAQCADPIPNIAGFVGLGGVYDTIDFAPEMEDFFGTEQSTDPMLWESGDPVAYAEKGEVPLSLRVLLLAGTDDTDVPMNQATTYAAVLKKKRIKVELEQLPGVDHMELIEPRVAAAPIIAFARSLSR